MFHFVTMVKCKVCSVHRVFQKIVVPELLLREILACMYDQTMLRLAHVNFVKQIIYK